MSAANRRKLINKLKSIVYLTTGGSLAYQCIYMKKDFNGYYENVLNPVTKFINPELTHKIGIFASKYQLFPKSNYVDPPELRTKLMELDLSSPIGIAAGFDKDGEAIEGLKNLGFSIIEIGSVTPEPQIGNPKPRVFRLFEDKAVINRYGFNSAGHEDVFRRVEIIDKEKVRPSIVGVNLGINKTSQDALHDYVLGIEKFANVADYFVINVSSPNTPGLRDLQQHNILHNLLSGINKARRNLKEGNPPLFLKLSPDLSEKERREISKIIQTQECRVDGLIVSNTTVERDNLVNDKYCKEIGGLSGKPLKGKSTEMIKEMYNLTNGKIPIIGVGGVFTGKDAFEKISAGASAVQIYTAFIYEGPPVVEKIKRELSDILREKGFENVLEAVGKGAK